MRTQMYIDKAMVLLSGPAGFLVLAVFVAACIAFLNMKSSSQR